MDEETIDKVPPPTVDRALTIDKVPSPAVDRALTILEKLVESRSPMTLTALAAEAGIPLATCAAIMQTFEARGYAARRVVGRSHFWRLTLKLNGLVAEYMRGIDLGQVVQPYLQELVRQTQMAAHVGLLEGDMIVYAAKAAAPGLVQFDTYPGKMTRFNITALGQAVAAYLPEDQIEPLLSHLAPGAGRGTAGGHRRHARPPGQGPRARLRRRGRGRGGGRRVHRGAVLRPRRAGARLGRRHRLRRPGPGVAAAQQRELRC